jgi:hypothetical protein
MGGSHVICKRCEAGLCLGPPSSHAPRAVDVVYKSLSSGSVICADLLYMRAMLLCYNAPRVSAEMGTVSPFRWLYGITPSC